jgi:predicted PurR-regulated permease PerM
MLNRASPLIFILTAVATTWALQWAAALLIPLVLSVLVALSLNPFVRWMGRLWVPRHLAAAIVLVFIIGASVTGAYALRGPAARAANRLPEVSERLRTELQLLRSYADGQRGTLGAIEQAADDLDAAASEVAGATVDDAPRTFDIGFRQWIVIGSMSAVGWTGQVLLLLFLVYFLLVSSDLFKRKLVRLAGPSLASRRVTVSAIDDEE